MAQWLPAVILAPFLVLYLITAFGRMTVPFELEWNEGQTFEQAIRFAQGKPLYPAPESGWVPYMYAPLYYVVVGSTIWATGSTHFFIGRFVSFLASLGTGAAIFWLVRDRTRQPAPALAAALLFYAFFQPCGGWYDLARVDSLATFLGMAGCAVLFSRRFSSPRMVAGLGLLLLATFTKQVFLPVLAFAGLQSMVRGNARDRVILALAGLVFLNIVVVAPRTSNAMIWKYTVTNSNRHLDNYRVLFPSQVPPQQFLASGPLSESRVAIALRYLREFRKDVPEAFESSFGRAVGPLAVCAAWLLVCLVRWRVPRGAMFLVPATLVAVLSILGFAKYGGYINNFLPLFAYLCPLVGFAFAQTTRLLQGRLRIVVPLVATALMLLDIVPAIAGGGTWCHHPSANWPSIDSSAAHARLARWLDERAKAGERVWILHHHFYAMRAGHPEAMNADMVRCATWAGDPVPEAMFRLVEERRFAWLVLDFDPIDQEWLPPGIADAIRANYDRVGPLPIYDGLEPRALVPVTGAPVRPQFLYRARAMPTSP